MSEKDELRRLLDERGVEWDRGKKDPGLTCWYAGEWRMNAKELAGGKLLLLRSSSKRHYTAEQAIAATLGNGKLTAEQVRELIKRHSMAVDYAGNVRRLDNSVFEEIANELNATISGGECKVVASSTDGLTTSDPKQWFWLSCGHSFKLDGLDAPVVCPICGKAVKR